MRLEGSSPLVEVSFPFRVPASPCVISILQHDDASSDQPYRWNARRRLPEPGTWNRDPDRAPVNRPGTGTVTRTGLGPATALGPRVGNRQPAPPMTSGCWSCPTPPSPRPRTPRSSTSQASRYTQWTAGDGYGEYEETPTRFVMKSPIRSATWEEASSWPEE